MDLDSNGGGGGRMSCDCSCRFCGYGSLVSSRSGRSLKRKIELVSEGARCGQIVDLAHVEIEKEVAALREAMGSHQQSIQVLCSELEEERSAAATAASEAMSMILRLQREKADAQMDARQFKGFAEEKMAHDQQEIALLEDLLYKRNQAIESFSYEIQAYRHRLLSFGISPYLSELSPLSINCEVSDFRENVTAFPNAEPENKYAFGSPSFRMELCKNEFSAGVEYASDTCGGSKDDISDRVYTIDALNGVDGVEDDRRSMPRELVSKRDGIFEDTDEAEMRSLYARLQALEADRESMRQAILSMGMGKAQVVLLKDIAQQLCEEVMPERRVVKKPPFVGIFPLISAIQWLASFFCWKKKSSKSSRIKYTFGLSILIVGLMILLEKSQCRRQARCLTRVRRGDNNH
ncbi:myosin-binding protein 7 isoform X2 [Dendrobium catenatum]|uniref:GTD-binding domain-containing protein n=1 Tax=Dendrobium catenatum TaxID=906689 RepID=A0A2I0WU78_9ASPA|nr:myosin-binding protein 7 isoform X2 [Dendrobium catenatum]PKU79211.1 hypothetical protein MA16_Dca000555 [Dendrobium catenatum]